MQFFGNEIEGFPELSYIAAIGQAQNNLSDELFKRVKRIEKADPQKNKLALDIRGLQNIKERHLASFNKLETKLKQINWDFYICNLPRQDQKLFFSKKDQDKLNIFETKNELLDYLEKQNSPNKRPKQSKPLKIGLRTVEGIRLFEGKAVRFDEEKDMLTVLTRDKNAAKIADKETMEAEIYFQSKKIQVLPHKVKLKDCRETKKKDYNYRLKAVILEVNQSDRKSLSQHFNG